jgi:hypothetical protein
MNLLNLYFAPFGATLVLVALFFSEPDRTTTYLSFVILALSLAVNWWFSKYTYRFIGWADKLRILQVWFSLLWSVLLFYLLFPFCAPTWILVLLPAVASALHQGRWQTLLTGCVAGAAVLGVYHLRWRGELSPSPEVWAQAFVHASFIPTLGLFVHALAQSALRMRDMRPRI